MAHHGTCRAGGAHLPALDVDLLELGDDRALHRATQVAQRIAALRAIGQKLLPKGDVDALFEEVRKYPRSHLARVYAAAINDLRDYRGDPDPDKFEETMSHAVEREGITVVQELKRGLSGLASIGATAPFVGLLGTVIGIMNAFFAMATAGQGGIGTVAGGIAEALVNTAVGLFVALPAVWGFNYFLNRIERFNVEMTTTGSELVDYFVKRFGGVQWKSATADH